ncbi:flagellar M-ring protein FliF [Persephonella atlantica]|uniref:Flagellar M-ring protein n=1 Tax=Persephonella atlantica TaxID=2699429 RepID=A0ABS1GHS9_9AQUI|nr:flagellar basal-body MS-ring/collar protein FliF [Persephonella atlantica]MBK3332470.1 flagellar M-ring protein FliF [Persephonella atlantica]
MEVKEIKEKALSFGKKYATPRNVALVVAGALLISLLGFVALKTVTTVNYGVLYTNLSPDDAGKILTVLQEEKIPYKVEGNGSIIMVPKDKIHEIRLKLASKGLPSSQTVGFEIFEEPKMGITQFQENVNYLRALEGELARTIRQIDAVQDVRINIALPKESIFVREEEEPKASVIVKLWPGKDLTKEQVKAIIFLVSHAVPRLKKDNVTVVDNRGRVLSDLLDEDSIESATDKTVQLKKKLEKQIERNIQSMLAKALGSDRVVVRASVELEVAKVKQKDEIVDPDKVAVVSERKIQEKLQERETPSVTPPGTSTNVPPVLQGTQTIITRDKTSKDQTKNYEISKTYISTDKNVFKIKRLSIGVLIDGKYEKVKDKNGNETVKFIPRSSEEIKTYEALIKSAVGFDPERGDQITVVSVPFETKGLAMEEKKAEIKNWILIAGIGALVLIITVIAGFMALKVLKKKKEEVTLPPGVTPEMAAGVYAMHEKEMEEFKLEKEPAFQKLLEIAEESPELLADLISRWLREEGT